MCPTPGPPTPRHPENAENPYSGGPRALFSSASRSIEAPREGGCRSIDSSASRARQSATPRHGRAPHARPIVRTRPNEIHASADRRDGDDGARRAIDDDGDGEKANRREKDGADVDDARAREGGARATASRARR